MRERWQTVEQAAVELSVSKATVWRWIRSAHEAQVPRQYMRVHDTAGRFRQKLIVEMNALNVYSTTVGTSEHLVSDTPHS